MNAATGSPVFYDCEASSLDGMPIEIGWAFVDSPSGEIRSEGHLIKPPAHWDMKPVWNPDAEKLHGITLRQLLRDGRPPLEIAARMNQVLSRRELFSDNPVFDKRWLRLLFAEAGIQPTFTVSPVNADLLTSQFAAKLGWDPASYEEAMADIDQATPIRHRAEAD